MISQHTALARATHGFKCFDSSQAGFTVWLVAETLGDKHTCVRSHTALTFKIFYWVSHTVDHLIKTKQTTCEDKVGYKC